MNHIKVKILLAACVTTLIFGCQNSPPADETIMNSFVGKWILPAHSEDHRNFIEEWTKENDSTYHGHAYVINMNTDDKFNEELLWIELRNGNWSYIADPRGQQRAVFTLGDLEQDRVRFVNPAHDFPKYIEYRWPTADSIVAQIGDSASSRNFIMVRMD